MDLSASQLTRDGCPQCGSSADSPFWTNGVCLRCAAGRLLGSDQTSGAQKGASHSVRSPIDGEMPERIGAYEILEELGHGGMGRVYAARQVDLGRIVALKVMSVAVRGVEFELRFLREAQTAARLRHPNLVGVHECGRAEGALFFSMEYIEGGDLSRRLRLRPFAPKEAAALLRKVALGLAYAHQEGVLHRDIKPSNILLDGEEPRLADFGLAAQLEVGGDLTEVTGVLGTPHYLAPEALKRGSAALSVSSDVYALGVVLFEMLTGRTPFAGATPATLAALSEESEPPSPRLLAPVVPRDLETICLKCLEREPSRRYASAALLAEDLGRFLDGEPILARPTSGAERLVRWCRRRPALAAVWTLMMMLAIGSTVSAIAIQKTLGRAQKAESESRERLREARLAEASALRQTTQPGRRAQALAALQQAAGIRPGVDIRDEATAALLIHDVQSVGSWAASGSMPGDVAFAPDGEIAAIEMIDATGELRNPVQLRRWGQSNTLARLETGDTRSIGPVCFSPDGSLLAERFADATIRVWRLGQTNAFLTLRTVPNPGGIDRSDGFNDDLSFSPDGTLLCHALPKGGIALDRVSDGARVAEGSADAPLTRIRTAPDGRTIAAMSGLSNGAHTIYLWSAEKLKVLPPLDLPSAPNSIDWSDDSRFLAVSLIDSSIEVFDVIQHRLLNSIHPRMRDPEEVRFLGRDSLIAVRTHGSTLLLLSAALGREQVIIQDFGRSRITTRKHEDRFAAVSPVGLATRWQVNYPTGLEILPPTRPDGYNQAINSSCMDISPDGKLLASSFGSTLVLRSLPDGHLLDEVVDSEIRGAEFSMTLFADGGRSVLRSSNRTGLWRHPVLTDPDGIIRLGPRERLDDEKGYILNDHTADGSVLVLVRPAEDRQRVRVLDYRDGKAKARAEWKVAGAYSAALNSDGSEVLVNCGGTGNDVAEQRLRVYRTSDGSVLHELPAQAFGETGWSANGRVAMTSNNTQLSLLWDAKTWKPLVALDERFGGNVASFAVAPDGSQAAVLLNQFLYFVSSLEGTVQLKIELPDAPGLGAGLRYLADGRSVAVLWRDGRVDLVHPAAIHAELTALGLDAAPRR